MLSLHWQLPEGQLTHHGPANQHLEPCEQPGARAPSCPEPVPIPEPPPGAGDVQQETFAFYSCCCPLS